MEKKISLNSHTFRRVFEDYTYLENQVNHVSVNLYGMEKQLADALTTRPISIDKFYHTMSTHTSRELVKNIELSVERLHRLWLIDFSDDTLRDFSYTNKPQVERDFSSFPNNTDLERDGSEPWLKNLQIELTDLCNERCVHCYIPAVQKDKGCIIETDTVKGLIKQYREMNGLRVVFSGGETLLHRDFFSILEYCRELDLMIFIQSNLLALTKENVKQLKGLDLFNVQVSLYSTDETIHDSITGRKNSCKKTKQNLELLIKNDIPVLISCPVMQQNYSTIRNLKEYAQSLGVDCYFDYIMMAQSDGCLENLDVRLNLEQTKQVLNDIIDMRPDFIEAIESSKSLDDLYLKRFARRWHSCKILSNGMCVDVDGTVYACPGWNGLSLGNIRQDELKNIWLHSSKTKELRATSKNKFLKCKECDLHNFCDMCPVYNFNETGDAFHVCQRFCKAAELLKECITEKYYHLNGQALS